MRADRDFVPATDSKIEVDAHGGVYGGLTAFCLKPAAHFVSFSNSTNSAAVILCPPP
jgi:hypothetical protein